MQNCYQKQLTMLPFGVIKVHNKNRYTNNIQTQKTGNICLFFYCIHIDFANFAPVSLIIPPPVHYCDKFLFFHFQQKATKQHPLQAKLVS